MLNDQKYRLGKVEKHCITWAYRQKKRNVVPSRSYALSQAALVLSYARNVLQINVPKKWNSKTLSHHPNFVPDRQKTSYRERFLKKPSVRKGFEKAFPEDREKAHRVYTKTYSTINRALINLDKKGFIRISQNVGSVSMGGPLNRKLGVNLLTFFELTELGRSKARELLGNSKKSHADSTSKSD